MFGELSVNTTINYDRLLKVILIWLSESVLITRLRSSNDGVLSHDQLIMTVYAVPCVSAGYI